MKSMANLVLVTVTVIASGSVFADGFVDMGGEFYASGAVTSPGNVDLSSRYRFEGISETTAGFSAVSGRFGIEGFASIPSGTTAGFAAISGDIAGGATAVHFLNGSVTSQGIFSEARALSENGGDARITVRGEVSSDSLGGLGAARPAKLAVPGKR